MQRLSGASLWRDVPRVGPVDGDAVSLVERWIGASPTAGSKYGLETVQIFGGGFTMRDPTYRHVGTATKNIV